ncbi:NADH-quinone oxidoreductase subunit NuoE [Inquilinus sp. Marseille-Q2685]|uniref:NADH-quinone oxidoreductase subunit NuoE n=1 Tax=Inquilinus sp. Marseille-Q2685 TaxID=2866581 RepID=UPI0027DFF65F|nr:NADH-quinone oxidoreductase subunit NuoE [Inquilinus sp. Marseille-Q2685]
MTAAGTAPEADQPKDFAFTPENLERAKRIIAKYPEGKQQSAVIPLLDIAQRQHHNWLPRAAMDHVADLLEMPRIRVYEVASFYTMFNKAPVGRHFFQVCTTTPCWLRGSGEVMRALKDKAGCGNHETSEDGQFSVLEVECLGACVNAPMVQINDDFYEDLDYDKTVALIEALKAGQPTTPGPQNGRTNSEALSGATTLLGLKPGHRPAVPASAGPVRNGTKGDQPDTAPGGAPSPQEVADQAEASPGAHRGDATPEKKARTQEKIDPPGRQTGTTDTGEK